VVTGPPAQLPEMPRAPFWMRRPRLLETSTTVVIVAALLTGAATTPFGGHPLGASVALLVSAAGVALGYRWPPAGLALLAAAPLVAQALGAEPIVTWQVSIFGAFLLSVRGLSGVLCGVVVGAADFLAIGLAAGEFGPTEPVAWIAATTGLAAGVTGSAIRGQRDYWSALQQRTHEVLAGRDAAVQRSVAEERLRIARDLHDTLGHEIAVVSMHLGAAEVRLPATAGQAREHLTAARGSVKSLLSETQVILRVLHADGEGAATGPVASHHDIPDLVDKVRAAGLRVDAVIGDLSRDLPPQVSAAAYRITQEALTNAQRHGRGRVSLTVDVSGPAVTVGTDNAVDLGAVRSDRTGQGLIGMRERAAAAGGRLDVSTDSGHFRLRAQLPVAEGALR
jgi:signal transduction histidine kinase